MNQLLADPIARRQQRDMAALVGSRKGTVIQVVTILAVVLIFGLILSALSGSAGTNAKSFESTRRDLARSGVLTDASYLQRHEDYRQWLRIHGTQGERRFFDLLSQSIFSSAASLVDGRNSFENLSFFQTVYASMHFAVIRVAFVVIASWRLWLFAILVALIWEYFSMRVHEGDDLLGQTGNGRLFFSGIELNLEPLNAHGAPETQIRGLACPAHVPMSVAAKSELAKILDKYGANNQTNQALISIILAYKDYPSYIAQSDETLLLEAAYEGSHLVESAEVILARALELHQKYRAMQMGNEKFDELDKTNEINEEHSQKKLSLQQFGERLQSCLHRVLTPEMRTHLAELRSHEVAALVLAYEAGKSLAFGNEAGGWVRKSNFPQLSARAVLHSISAFAREYNFDERTTLRRALIFASRSSSFGPVRFPTDLSDQSRAARQWVEVLMSSPHELQAVADEVELIGIVAEAQRAWSQVFLDGAMALDPDVVDDVYATPTNLFFMPVIRVLALMRRVVEHGTLRRMEELIAKVSQRQRLQSMSLDFSLESGTAGSERGPMAAADRIFAPLAHREVKALASEHGLGIADVRDWSSLRVVLNLFGWLGRRIGDYSVPESSLISVVFKVEPSMPGANEHGRMGKHGLVAFRGTRLQAKWGQFWQSRFISVQGVTMAETPHDYEQLMQGIEKSIDEDEQIAAVGNEVAKV